MSTVNKHCGFITHNKVRIKNPHYSFLSTLLIVLLPKCPFCVMAYTSAITMCGAGSMTGYSTLWTSYISICLALLTFLIVAWNYKGKKTILACLLILTGSLFIIQSELYSGLLTGYYWGSAMLFVGIWVNGNFSYFVRLVALRSQKTAWQHA